MVFGAGAELLLLADVPAPPGGFVFVLFFLLLLHAPSSSAIAATAAVIATRCVRRNAITLRCPNAPRGNIACTAEASVEIPVTVVAPARNYARGIGTVTRSLHPPGARANRRGEHAHSLRLDCGLPVVRAVALGHRRERNECDYEQNDAYAGHRDHA